MLVGTYSSYELFCSRAAIVVNIILAQKRGDRTATAQDDHGDTARQSTTADLCRRTAAHVFSMFEDLLELDYLISTWLK